MWIDLQMVDYIRRDAIYGVSTWNRKGRLLGSKRIETNIDREFFNTIIFRNDAFGRRFRSYGLIRELLRRR